jgi:hypothetical protein
MQYIVLKFINYILKHSSIKNEIARSERVIENSAGTILPAIGIMIDF